MTGILVWIGSMISLGSVVMMVNVSSDCLVMACSSSPKAQPCRMIRDPSAQWPTTEFSCAWGLGPATHNQSAGTIQCRLLKASRNVPYSNNKYRRSTRLHGHVQFGCHGQSGDIEGDVYKRFDYGTKWKLSGNLSEIWSGLLIVAP
jgi:hypothetical protein